MEDISSFYFKTDAATLLSKLLTSSAYFQGSSFKEDGCTPLPSLSARPLGSGPGTVHLGTWVRDRDGRVQGVGGRRLRNSSQGICVETSFITPLEGVRDAGMRSW